MKSTLAHNYERLDERLQTGHNALIDKLDTVVVSLSRHLDNHDMAAKEKRGGSRSIIGGIVTGIAMLVIAFVWNKITK